MRHDLGRFGTLALGLLLSSSALVRAQEAAKQPTPASWFRVQSVAEGVWRIYDDYGAGNAYVVTGKDKALLIDTGTGVADLAATVRGITSLPLTVVNTHGHGDHVGANFQFDAVSVHPDDFELTIRSSPRENREGTVKRLAAQVPALEPLLLKSDAELDQKRLVPVRGGHVFDLGGRKIEVIETPGHTKGSICLLDKERKLLFAGDTTNSLVWLFLGHSLPLETYLQSLKGLQQRAAEYTTIMPGHNEPLEGSFIADQIGCVESILAGACKAEPYPSRMGVNAQVCAFKRAQVTYDPGNLRAKK
jgi:hydroxyacylglutathione hydrolase